MVEPAQHGEVARRRRPRLWSTLRLGVVVVLGDVVDVAAPGRAGAPREHACAVAENNLLADPVGDVVGRGGEVDVEVDDRLDGDLGPGVGTPVADLVEQDQPLALLHAPGGTEHRRFAGEACVEVGVEHDLACGGQVLTVGSRSGEVEGGLRAGQVTQRLGPPCVQRLGRPQCGLCGSTVGHRAVEVDRVGDVDLGLYPYRAREVDVVVVDRDVARVDVQVAVLRIRRGVGVGEVEPLDRLGDEPVQLRRADAPGDRGDLRVHERRSLARQGWGGVDGGLGDRPGLPRRDLAGLDLCPQAGEAVAQLEGVADELLRRGGRRPEDPAELGDAELRHERRTLTRDGFLVLATRHGEVAAAWIDSGGCRSAHCAARTS